jgi:hypothetical protein
MSYREKHVGLNDENTRTTRTIQKTGTPNAVDPNQSHPVFLVFRG